MQPPSRFCKALYRPKQAPRAWFTRFSSTISQSGFQSNPHYHALFLQKTKRGIILLLLYVDNMIITGDDTQGIHN